MIKLCWWLFRTLIWGNNFKIDFNYSVDFEEALIYLKKGYFIHRLIEDEILYVKIKGSVYAINTKKKEVGVVNSFTSQAIESMWKVIPERMQTEKVLNKD